MQLTPILQEIEQQIGTILDATGEGVSAEADDIETALEVAFRLSGQTRMVYERLWQAKA